MIWVAEIYRDGEHAGSTEVGDYQRAEDARNALMQRRDAARWSDSSLCYHDGNVWRNEDGSLLVLD